MGRVGLCTIAFKQFEVSDIISIAARTGASALEIWGQPPHISYPLDYQKLEATRTEAERNNLDPVVFGSYYRPGKPVEYNGVVVDLENQIEAARILGSQMIRIWAGDDNPGTIGEQAETKIIDAIRRFADSAADSGMETILERHNNSLTHGWDSPRRLLERIDHDHVFLNYQIPYPMPESDLAERSIGDYRRLLPLAKQAHMQNYQRSETGELERTFLDSGVVDYGELPSAITESGYDGYLMIEFCALDVDHLTDRNRSAYIDAIGRDTEYLETLLPG